MSFGGFVKGIFLKSEEEVAEQEAARRKQKSEARGVKKRLERARQEAYMEELEKTGLTEAKKKGRAQAKSSLGLRSDGKPKERLITSILKGLGGSNKKKGKKKKGKKSSGPGFFEAARQELGTLPQIDLGSSSYGAGLGEDILSPRKNKNTSVFDVGVDPGILDLQATGTRPASKKYKRKKRRRSDIDNWF